MYRFAPILAAGYVGDVDPDAVTEVVDEAGQQLSALQNFLIDAAPSIRAFVFNLIIAVIIYIVGRKLIKLATRILEKFLGRTGMDAGVSTFLVSTARALLYVLLAFVIVGQLGVNTASIVTLLGTAGIAIGMSLQGSLANVAGGILILLMKPFRGGGLCVDFVRGRHGQIDRPGLYSDHDCGQPGADDPERRALELGGLQCQCDTGEKAGSFSGDQL